MAEGSFHFAQPWWLLGLLAIPLVLAWLRYSRPLKRRGQEYRYADAELLPHLTGEVTTAHRRNGRVLLAWSMAWALLVLALAGPRWDYQRVSAFQTAANLVVLLDISASMQIQDVRPSRLERARQEIQDLLRLNPGVRIGLIAFATVAHVVAPVTEDMETLRQVLPSLSTDLVRLPGSRLSNALKKASLLLSSEDENSSHHILLVSDGDFDEPGLDQVIDQLRNENIQLHVLGIGTDGGGPVPYMNLPGGRPVVSRMDATELKALASRGNGLFFTGQFSDQDIRALLEHVVEDAGKSQVEDFPTRVWNERFYLLLIPALLLMLYLFGNGNRFARGAS